MLFDIKTVEKFALSYIEIEYAIRGELFATPQEYKYIVEDIFAYSELWKDAFFAMFRGKTIDSWHVNHNKKTVEVFFA